MPGAAADIPAGNHHVFAMKKYVLRKVISQTITSRARPMQVLQVRLFPRPAKEGFNQKSAAGREVYHSYV
jgi:hypothetical protein